MCNRSLVYESSEALALEGTINGINIDCVIKSITDNNDNNTFFNFLFFILTSCFGNIG